MTEAEVVKTLRGHFEGLFPRVCSKCGRRFANLQEYILVTQRIGPSVSYDAELGLWDTVQPIGSLVPANCPCGTTLCLGTEDMPLPEYRSLLAWVKGETQRRGVSPGELLEHLRDRIRKQVFAGSDQMTAETNY
jgi:hypothetical protein